MSDVYSRPDRKIADPFAMTWVVYGEYEDGEKKEMFLSKRVWKHIDALRHKDIGCNYCGEGIAEGWRLDQLYEYKPGKWVCVICVRRYE